VINEEIIAPRGADVTGRVVAVRRSGRLHKPGYLRITLTSLTLQGQQIPVSTSSFFVQGASPKKRNWALIGGATVATGKKDIAIGVERHLTFRLTQPIVIHG